MRNPTGKPRRLGLAAALVVGIASACHAAPGGGPLSFLVVGDWGRDGAHHQREVARQMGRVAAETRAAFVVSTGDNFYQNGVASVEASKWKTSFENIYTAPSLQIPWYVVLGNHDYRGNPSAEVDYTWVSPRWRMPARYFRRQFPLSAGGSAEFFFLDTQPFVEAYRRNSRYSDVARQSRLSQLSWLESGLASSHAEWKIVVGHHPVFSRGWHGDTPELVQEVKPLLERYGVQVYLNGHDHDMQHIVVNGVNYVTSGAGSRTRRSGRGPDTRFALGKTSGFLAVELTEDRFAGRFIDRTGKEVYAFVQARADSLAPALQPR